MTDEYYMLMALKEARMAYEAEEVPVGAIIVQNSRILAKGHNQVEKLNDPTAHAEMLALTSAFNFLGSKYLPDATIYITVEPCLMCAGALYWSKIGKVVYGASDAKNGYAKFCKCLPQEKGKEIDPWPFHPRTVLAKGILEDDCALLMKDFFKARR